jgi:YggT family protein
VPPAGHSPAPAAIRQCTSCVQERRNNDQKTEIRVVGADIAITAVLADTVSTIQGFVVVFVAVYVLVIFAYVLTSFVRLPYSLNPVQRFLYDVCEPYLRLFRRILPPLGPIDLSPMIGVLVLIGGEQLVVRLLDRLH